MRWPQQCGPSHLHTCFAVQHWRTQAGYLVRRWDPCSRVGYSSYCTVDSRQGHFPKSHPLFCLSGFRLTSKHATIPVVPMASALSQVLPLPHGQETDPSNLFFFFCCCPIRCHGTVPLRQPPCTLLNDTVSQRRWQGWQRRKPGIRFQHKNRLKSLLPGTLRAEAHCADNLWNHESRSNRK